MQVLSVLIHSSLATVLNYGEMAGQLYVVRWYSNNGSLLSNEGRKSFNPPLSVNDAFTYAYQLSQALHLVHSYGYAHGALTFSNILISERSQAENDRTPLLLSDAGLAQFVRRFGRAQSGMLPMTAAPEQFEGQTTPASDQYALAILLSVWLTGRPPFAGNSAEIERLKRAGVIPAVQAGLTVEQENIIRRALNAKQDARYPSILAFAEALMNSLSSAPSVIEKAATIEMHNQQEEAEDDSTQKILEPAAGVTMEEQEQPTPAEPLPSVEPNIPQPQPEPDVPQPRPAPQIIPETQPAPVEPPITPPNPKPEVEPVVIPPPAPDIAQPLPEQTPFPPNTEPVQPQTSPQPEVEQSTQEIAKRYTEPLAHPAHTNVVPTPYLLITSSFPREPRKIPLQKDEITLGRAGSSDILLDEDTLTSRHHAYIKREGKNYVIYDTRSTYGVLINEQKLVEGIGHSLQEGDHIQIGDYSLLFSFQLTEDTDAARIEHALL
jgi:serine/threonine protein kinase